MRCCTLDGRDCLHRVLFLFFDLDDISSLLIKIFVIECMKICKTTIWQETMRFPLDIRKGSRRMPFISPFSRFPPPEG